MNHRLVDIAGHACKSRCPAIFRRTGPLYFHPRYRSPVTRAPVSVTLPLRETSLRGMRVGRSKRIILALPVSLALLASLPPSSTVVPRPPSSSWETRRCDASPDPFPCASDARVQRRSRALADRPDTGQSPRQAVVDID